MIAPLRSLPNWWFVVVAISLSNAPVIEAAVQINITLLVDNPTTVHVNTPVVYLRWNYSIGGDEDFKEVDFHYGSTDVYIGYIDPNRIVVASKFKERFDLEKPGTLIIHNVTESDTGTYIFDVKTTQATKFSSTVYLDVLFPVRFIDTPTNKTIIETEIVTFFCNATGNPTPTIKWFREGQSVGTGNPLSFPVYRNHSGYYLCTADNDLNVTLNASAYLEVHYPSEIDNLPSDKTVIEGYNVTLHCNATGNPTPNVTWTKDGSQTVLQQGREFSITNISRQQHGSYKCSAWNYVGQPAVANFSITVHFKPSVSVQLCPSSFTEGSNVTLHCNATGNPPPTITWIQRKTGDILASSEQLFLAAVNRSQAGPYQCHASNGIGSNSSRICNLDVLYQPTGTSMTTMPTNTTLLHDSNMLLNCSTDANPEAHVYHFYFNDALTGNSSSGMLNVTVDEDGVYTCVPINTVGTGHNATVSITAVDTPSVDIDTTMTSVIEGNNITFSCNASGKPEPVITWAKVGEAKVLSQSSSFTVVNVSRPETPNNMIQYQCTASNGVGTSATATVNVAVHFPPEIVSAPSASQVTEGSGAILFCNATGNPQPNITWTKQGNNSELSSSENLNLTNLMREDDGSVYKCTATNYIGSAEATAKVTVWFEPSITSQQCSSPVTEGDNATLHCNATGNPLPNIAWIKTSTKRTVSYTEILFIEDIKRNESGSYECLAWNGIGNNSTNSCTIDVHYLPTALALSTTPANTTVLRGATLELYCRTDANPAAHMYNFYLNDNLIGNSSSGVLNVTVDEDGVYTCVPINTVGTGHNATVSITTVVAPSVEVSNTALIVLEANNISLTCNASGKPQPSITWTKVGSLDVLSNTSSLTIVNVSRPGTPDNMIQYQCTASNGVETPAAATVNVTVQFPPQIDSAQSASQVIEGSGAMLFCNATGNPQPNITWTKQGNNSELSTSENLNLTNLMREDDGSVYKCTATNYIGSAETTTTVTVFFPPKSAIHDCPNQVPEDDNVTLYCNATGNPPPKVAWIRSGEVLVNDGIHVIPAINRSQAGTYECMAWNGIGNNFTTNCTVDVQYPPASTMITTLPSNTTVLINAAVSLMCATVANPAAHIYHFYLNNNLIGNSSSGVLNITVKADGVYTCVPINMVGTGDNATVSVTAVVAPFAEIIPQVVTVIEGGNFTLTCNVSGVPSPSILWTQIGSSKVLSQNSTLTVMNVSKPGTPDNMIQYQCSASNGVEKRASVTINITVHFVPEILQAPSSTSLLEGNNATLLCRVTGSPLPNITWIKTGDNRTLSTSETLHLENLTRVDDKTEYRCIAKNSIGSAEALAVVTVQYPSLFESSPVHQVVLEGSNLTLHCNATGNPTPNITWTKDGSSTVLHQGETFRIANIQRQAAGDYKCTAWNGVGEQKNATVTITVHYNSVINWTPSGGVVLEGSNLTLHCNATGNPTPNITWTKDGSSTVLHQGETYSIGNIQRQAAGDYKCTAWNGVGERKNATATVTVHFPPKSAIHDCPNQVTEGDNVTLYCNATGNPPPKVAWIRSGQVLVKDNTYLIPAINRSQAETYECMTWNGIGNNITTNCTVDVQYPPASTMITTLPSNTTLLRDAAVSLKCTTVANPAAHIYHFYLNNNLIGNSSSGVLNVTVKADGVYTCVPVNTVGKGDNATVSISAVVAPFAEIIPQVVTVTEGGNFTLTCNVSGVPSPTILWTQIGSSKVLSQNSTLTVMNVSRPGTPDNMIQYQCSASNGVEKRASATVNVTVHFLPEIVKAPSSTSVIEGNNTTLLCRVTGSPLPNITWIKTGDNRTLSTSETLHLENLTRVDDETEYRCIAKNSIGSAEALAVVTVHYPSLLGSAPVHEVVLEGSNLTLQCNATGNPTPNITWTKDGNSTVLHKGETYSIVNIQRQAAGDYKCTAWNGVGERKNATATVTVHFPAAIESTSSTTLETEDSNVTIYCNATGNPTPNITWRRRGSSAVLHHGESYIIYNITRNQAGDYICSAWNKIEDKDNATITVTVQYPSAIESSSGNRVVLEGNNLTLHCNATGNPTPNITWTKDGSSTVLHQGETYSIVNVQRQAAGDYKCTAWNGVGEQKNATATVTVHFPAAIVRSSSNTVETEASNVTIYCNATGNPTPNITWTRRGSSAVLHHGEIYIIYNINRNQAGDYICSAWNKIEDKDNATITITVQYPATIESSSGNRVVLEGNNLTLHCNATGNPTPNITWTKDGSSTVLHQGETYSMVNIQRQAAGDYKCTAWNGVGERKNATATVTVHFPAAIVSSSSNTVETEASNVTIYCNATGNPTPNITWTRRGSSAVLHHRESYIIYNITRNQAGDYICSAWNKIKDKDNATITITVQYPATIESSSGNRVVLEGNNLTLHCNATGNPTPNITWTKDGSSTVLYQGETYRIVNIQRQAAGDYKCTAWNGVGERNNVTATVTVHFPAAIVSSSSNTVETEASNVTIYCNATGNPTPNITWTRRGSSAVLHHGESYIIYNITRNQAGDYICSVWNKIKDKDNATITVTVQYPSAIESSSGNRVVLEGNNLTLHCNATGNPTPNITWTKDGSSTVLHQGERYSIVNIQRQAAGDYKCTAWNGLGEQKNATVTVDVHYAADIISAPNNKTVVEYDTVIFICNATSNPPSQIIWTQDGNSTVLHQGDTFIIENITRKFNGRQYTCTTQNNVTQDVQAHAHVTVHYSPEVLIKSISPVVEGDNLLLACHVTGNPPPKVLWIRGSDNSVITQKNIVILTNITRADAVVFQCFAWNGIGKNASSNVTVDVLYPAEIVTSPVDQVVWVGEPVALFCNATGNPAPNISYSVVGENGTVGIAKTLVINSSSVAYVKVYTCAAENGLQPPATANVTVTVLVRPCSSNPCLRGSCTDLKTPAYRCKCSIGYQGTNCDEPIPQETVSVKGEIKLKTVQSQYHPDYKNHSSKRFKELSRAFEDNVTELYKDENQFGHVKVEAILNGSIVVNFTLVFLKGNQTVDQLLKILEIAVENRTIHLLPVERDTLRLILPTTPAPSASTTIRTVRAPSAAAQRKQVASWMIALMGGIGGLIFLVLVCAIIHCCVHGNRKTKKEELRLEYEDDTGRWIDLPHVKNGFKPSENELALTNSGAYLEEGPTVEEPLHQEHAIEEQLPGVRTVSGGILETNGNSTRL
ncbi:hemicentin-2-like isoform X6 [Oculina patagonica]